MLDNVTSLGSRLLVYRGLEMAQQGRMLSVIAKYWLFTAAADGDSDAAMEAADLIVANFATIQGAAGVLRERRAAALSDPAVPKTSPKYGMPTGNDEADLWHRTTGLAGGQQTQMPYFSIAAEMYVHNPTIHSSGVWPRCTAAHFAIQWHAPPLSLHRSTNAMLLLCRYGG